MGGVGKNEEKSGNLAKICTNFKELGRILESHEIFCLKIVVWGGGNSWKSGGKFPEKWSWGGDYNSERESIKYKILTFFNRKLVYKKLRLQRPNF